jgi:hypothetical protein
VSAFDRIEAEAIRSCVQTGHGIALAALMGTPHAGVDVEIISAAIRWAMQDARVPLDATTRCLAVIGAEWLRDLPPHADAARQLIRSLALSPTATC